MVGAGVPRVAGTSAGAVTESETQAALAAPAVMGGHWPRRWRRRLPALACGLVGTSAETRGHGWQG